MQLVRTGSLLKFNNPSQYRIIVHKTWKSIHIFHQNSKRKKLLLQLNFKKFCYNHQSPNKHSKFHTSPRRHFDPTVWPIIRNVLKGTGIISGRGFRQWWQALPDKKRRYFFHSARKKRHELILLITLLGCCFYVYHWKHLQVAPVSGRERFIAFTDYQFDKIMEFQAQKLCAELKGKYLPANHLYYGVVLNTLNVLINANQDISQVKDIKWTVAIVEDPAVNAVVLSTGHIFVNRGLIEFVHDVDQLAFVLAHEMSHAILKHTAENLSRLQLVDYLVISTMTTLWALMPNDGIAIVFHWFLNKVVNVLLDLPYSRFLENEADKVGLELAAKACYDIRCGTVFWTMMSLAEQLEGRSKPEWLSTHPSSFRRAELFDCLIHKYTHVRHECKCPPLPDADPRGILHDMKVKVDNIVTAKKTRARIERFKIQLPDHNKDNLSISLTDDRIKGREFSVKVGILPGVKDSDALGDKEEMNVLNDQNTENNIEEKVINSTRTEENKNVHR